MSDILNNALKDGNQALDAAIHHLTGELIKIRTGKASPAMLDGVMVEYYGNPTPLNQVANISTPDAKTLSIQPWEKSMLAPIEQAIFASNLGLTPMNDGEMVRINIPPLTEDRRKVLVKQAKSLGEDAKVSIRNTRRELMEAIKKVTNQGLSEDQAKREEGKVDGMIKNYTDRIDSIVSEKEKEIMTI